jgi:hypothetical protein
MGSRLNFQNVLGSILIENNGVFTMGTKPCIMCIVLFMVLLVLHITELIIDLYPYWR